MAIELTAYLAMLYFPFCTKQNARRNFTHLINSNAELVAELQRLDWNTSKRIITPRQRAIIERYLGIP